MPVPVPVPISGLYAALLGLLIVILILAVIRLRRSLRIGFGDGGNRDMQRAIRVHGNAIECVPLFLIMLAVFELNHGSVMMLHLFGASFLLSRVLHAWGLYSSGGESIGRVGGMVITISVLIALAVANLLKIF